MARKARVGLISSRVPGVFGVRAARKAPQAARKGDMGLQLGVLLRLAGRKRSEPWSTSEGEIKAASGWRRRKAKANRQVA